MNAVDHLSALLSPESVRRLATLRVHRVDHAPLPRRDLDIASARAHVTARWSADLCGFLNALTRGELVRIARALELPGSGRSPELREAVWNLGAAIERAGVDVAPALQPRPIVLGGHLVVQAPPRGDYPPSDVWPRAVPPAQAVLYACHEPDTLDELLASADRALGVRLGRRGRDKGAWGNRAAGLLGIVERGGGEPDWRGDVEIKTVPVARDRSGMWRIVEDPAIAMVGESPVLAKLQRTLWLARVDLADGDATLLSWYLLQWDAHIAMLANRYLHLRPKGPAGTDARAFYLHKRFFADAGMLATLNGIP